MTSPTGIAANRKSDQKSEQESVNVLTGRQKKEKGEKKSHCSKIGFYGNVYSKLFSYPPVQ